MKARTSWVTRKAAAEVPRFADEDDGGYMFAVERTINILHKQVQSRQTQLDMTYDAHFEQWVPVPLERVFLFFANPGNLPRIMPPATGTEVLRVNLVPPPGVAPERATITNQQPLAGAGSELVTSFRVLPFLPFRAQWIALITQFEWNHHFADVQKKGPFRRFQHRHEFEAETCNGVEGTRVRDVIAYEIGFGILGALVQRLFVARQFRKIFAYRQKALAGLLAGKRL